MLPWALGGGGCLSQSYTVSQSELMRLAQLPAATRWQSVRATQSLGGDNTPPQRGVTVWPVAMVIDEPVGYAVGGRWRLTPPAMGVGWRSRRAVGSGGGLNLGGLGRGSSGRSGGGGGSGGSGGGGGGNSGAAAAAVLVAAVVAGAVVVFVLAGSEGARYDGWLSVNPNEDLYLEQDGQTLAVPLPLLTPELAMSAYSARLYEGPAARYARLARAPLNREGFTLSAGVGAAWFPNDGVERPLASFSGHTFFGFFPTQFLGIGLSADVIARNALVGTVGPELRVMPSLYAGAYAGAGWVFGRSGGEVSRDLIGNFVRGGFLGELPVTTRMSFQLRAGLAWMTFNNLGDTVVPEASAALAIY